nr:YjbH domain-containing protein [Ruegeria sp. R14_0]
MRLGDCGETDANIRAVTQRRTGLLALVCVLATGLAQAQSVSIYGTPGLIEIPTAETFDDGELVFTAAGSRNTGRATLTFQLLPWAHGSFRYAYICGFDGESGDRYDRSFDVHFRLREDSRTGPAIVMGLRSFGGTGIYATECSPDLYTGGSRYEGAHENGLARDILSRPSAHFPSISQSRRGFLPIFRTEPAFASCFATPARAL